jgi:hypothetical protein
MSSVSTNHIIRMIDKLDDIRVPENMIEYTDAVKNILVCICQEIDTLEDKKLDNDATPWVSSNCW